MAKSKYLKIIFIDEEGEKKIVYLDPGKTEVCFLLKTGDPLFSITYLEELVGEPDEGLLPAVTAIKICFISESTQLLTQLAGGLSTVGGKQQVLDLLLGGQEGSPSTKGIKT